MMRRIDRDRMWVSLTRYVALVARWVTTVPGCRGGRESAAAVRTGAYRLGSDWPVGGDAADAFDLLGDWCEDETLRRRVLVDNATEFFRYKPSP